jgi:hypothetical protein
MIVSYRIVTLLAQAYRPLRPHLIIDTTLLQAQLNFSPPPPTSTPNSGQIGFIIVNHLLVCPKFVQFIPKFINTSCLNYVIWKAILNINNSISKVELPQIIVCTCSLNLVIMQVPVQLQ